MLFDDEFIFAASPDLIWNLFRVVRICACVVSILWPVWRPSFVVLIYGLCNSIAVSAALVSSALPCEDDSVKEVCNVCCSEFVQCLLVSFMEPEREKDYEYL